MRKISSILFCLFSLFCVKGQAAHFENFKATAYVPAWEINSKESIRDWERFWKDLSAGITLDKVYLEVYRDRQFVDRQAMETAIRFFRSKGVEMSGGITYHQGGTKQPYVSFCYSDPVQLATVREAAEMAAGWFDEVVLDDFYFTNCKCDLCIDAKGDRSWSEFRRKLLDDVAREYIIGPARKVNPRSQVVVKYPNWYEHFQETGFDLERGPYTFDGVYTGNETRDPSADAHLQPYESYSIFRFFDALNPGHNRGGWVDTGGAYYPDMFAEQLWLTLLAKAPEITLFTLAGMNRPAPQEARAWEGKGSTLGRATSSWGAVAQAAFRKIDPILGKLGRPTGVKAYKPLHSVGEDYLHNYMGMMGIPMDIVPNFPTAEEAPVVILTESAACDPDIISKMRSYMRAGGEIIVTSGFYSAVADKGIREFINMNPTNRKALARTATVSRGMGWGMDAEETATPIQLPVFNFYCNDSWDDITVQVEGESGYSMFQYGAYSRGAIFVWMIPDDFAHLYALPQNALDRIRNVASAGSCIRLQGPSKVALFTYDNDTFVLYNFNDKASSLKLSLNGAKGISNLENGAVTQGNRVERPDAVYGREAWDETEVPLELAPHSLHAFRLIR